MWLTPEQKCDIATWELEEVRGELEKLRLESERVLDSYKVKLLRQFLSTIAHRNIQIC